MDSTTVRLDVQALLVRLARETDFGSVEEYVDCFTEDAAIEIQGRPARVGREAITTAAVEGRAAGTVGPDSKRYHVVIPGEVRADGERATCESRFLFVGSSDEGTGIISVGRYHDELRRTADGWKLNERVIEFG